MKSRFTTGAASRSFTSTAYDPVTKNEYEYVKVEKNPKKKGYVRLQTTHGDLNIELHCDITPRTCENFITLCERGYYNGIAFHRNIRYSEFIFHLESNEQRHSNWLLLMRTLTFDDMQEFYDSRWRSHRDWKRGRVHMGKAL